MLCGAVQSRLRVGNPRLMPIDAGCPDVSPSVRKMYARRTSRPSAAGLVGNDARCLLISSAADDRTISSAGVTFSRSRRARRLVDITYRSSSRAMARPQSGVGRLPPSVLLWSCAALLWSCAAALLSVCGGRVRLWLSLLGWWVVVVVGSCAAGRWRLAGSWFGCGLL